MFHKTRRLRLKIVFEPFLFSSILKWHILKFHVVFLPLLPPRINKSISRSILLLFLLSVMRKTCLTLHVSAVKTRRLRHLTVGGSSTFSCRMIKVFFSHVAAWTHLLNVATVTPSVSGSHQTAFQKACNWVGRRLLLIRAELRSRFRWETAFDGVWRRPGQRTSSLFCSVTEKKRRDHIWETGVRLALIQVKKKLQLNLLWLLLLLILKVVAVDLSHVLLYYSSDYLSLRHQTFRLDVSAQLQHQYGSLLLKGQYKH